MVGTQMNDRFRLFFELDTGVRQPQTEAQRHFVTVCRGDAAQVTTQERVYLHIRVGRQIDVDHMRL